MRKVLSCIFLLGLGWAGLLRAEDGISADEVVSRIRTGLSMLDYKGTMTYIRGDDATTLSIQHRLHEGVEQEYVQTMEGQRRETLRWGPRVVCLDVEQGRDVVRLISTRSQSQPDVVNSEGLNRVYMVHPLGGEKLAGRESEKYHLMAVDEYRYSQMVWLDSVSGLPLRSVILDREGQVLESVQFSGLELDPDFTPEFEAKFASFEQFFLQNDGQKAVPQTIAGWNPGWLPDAFHPAVSTLLPGEEAAGDGLAYTDGLSRFTVFVEPPGAGQMPEGSSRKGATTALTRHHVTLGQRYAITVIGEIPLVTAIRVVDNMRMGE